MSKYAYKFQLYGHGNIFNEGYHYVLANDVHQAQEMIKQSFPNQSISSYVKLSDNPITYSELSDLINEYNRTNDDGGMTINDRGRVSSWTTTNFN